MLAYFLKVNIAIVLFYAFYRLFFYKDTFFGWRRTALLCFFALSAAYPLLNIQTWVAEQEPMVAMADLYASVLPEFTFTPEVEAATDWKSSILTGANILYWGVVSLLFIRFFIQLTGIVRLFFRCSTMQTDGKTIHLLSSPNGPFSFFHWIFIHPASHTEEEFNEILTHEQTHARQWHSVDVLVSELACILCWFNPFVWLMKREVRTNLEYMADARVIENGHDSKTYQYHLLGLSHHKAAATIYNSFNVLPLKKRIKMMNKKRTKKIGRTKYLMFLPLAALLMIISNIETVARTTEKIATDVIENISLSTSYTAPIVQDTVIASEPIFEVVENMPEFPDGIQASVRYIENNIKYPADAKEKGIQGRVVLQFIVNQDGSFSNFKVLRGLCPSLDAEAIRVIKSMPKWKPGTQRGKAVRVKYTLPVMFKLPNAKSTKEAIAINESEFADIVVVANSLEEKEDEDAAYMLVEHMPKYPGGMEAIMQYIARNIKYPTLAVKNKEEGRVTAEMIIGKDGSVSNVKILRGVSPLLDAEAIRVLSGMPDWEPGMDKGKPVAVKYTLPVIFRLQ